MGGGGAFEPGVKLGGHGFNDERRHDNEKEAFRFLFGKFGQLRPRPANRRERSRVCHRRRGLLDEKFTPRQIRLSCPAALRS